MSGICGIYHADGAPVDQDLLHRMNDIVDFRGPNGSGAWTNGKTGLAHQLLWTTEESVNEKQPLTNGRGLWITADCRIDNREDLKKEFQIRGIWRSDSTAPDCYYILLAYQLWEEDAPNHLLGDFAFAIWDEQNQKLFCARDQIGIKPFFYHWNGVKFLFGSEMKQIFQDDLISTDLHIPHLADFILMKYPYAEDTFYQAIRKLPPGHWIEITKGRLKQQKYWHWHPDSEPKSAASVEENAEKFCSIFGESVRARLRTAPGYRTGSLLSGGLDSSSIVSVAASMTQFPFPVFNVRFPEADRCYQLKNMDWVDESPYIRDLVQKYGLEFNSLEIRERGPFQNLEENSWLQENPIFFPNLGFFQLLFMSAGKSGIRTLLHGEGGDEVFGVGSQCRFGGFKNGNWFEFWKDCQDRRKKLGSSSVQTLNSLFRTLLPEWTKAPYRRFAKKVVPDWINPVFSKKFSLSERIRKDFHWDPKPHSSTSYGIQLWVFWAMAPYYLETMDRAGASAHLEFRLPFLDLRLFRFAASLPWDQKMRRGETKFLLRQAFKDRLPLSIRERYRKTEFTPVVQTSLQLYASEKIREAFKNPHPLMRDMLSKKAEMLYKHGFLIKTSQSDKILTSRLHLWYLTSLDQWLKFKRGLRRKSKEGSHEKRKTAAAEKN